MVAMDLGRSLVHLGLGGGAVVQPDFTGDMGWYAAYGERHGGDGNDGRLVSMHSFSTSWDVWEMHPNGAEVVVCTAGVLTLVQDTAGEVQTTTLSAGEYVINEPGTWHTADVEEGQTATALFITSGIGTEHRPR